MSRATATNTPTAAAALLDVMIIMRIKSVGPRVFVAAVVGVLMVAHKAHKNAINARAPRRANKCRFRIVCISS